MSLEIYALSSVRLESIASWQKTIDSEGFDLRLSAETSFETVRGFLPATLAGKVSGFECYHDDLRDLLETYPDLALAGDWIYALGFRWGTSFEEGLAAWMAASAYASATDGVVYDPQENKVFSPQQARDIARDQERDMPAAKERVRELLKKMGLA